MNPGDNMNFANFTFQDRITIQHKLQQGFKTADIAKFLGVAYGSIFHELQRPRKGENYVATEAHEHAQSMTRGGRPASDFPEEIKLKLDEMIEANESMSKISNVIGINISRVSRYIKKNFPNYQKRSVGFPSFTAQSGMHVEEFQKLCASVENIEKILMMLMKTKASNLF